MPTREITYFDGFGARKQQNRADIRRVLRGRAMTAAMLIFATPGEYAAKQQLVPPVQKERAMVTLFDA